MTAPIMRICAEELIFQSVDSYNTFSVPSHKDGHTLDLLITHSSDDPLTSNISVNEGGSVHEVIMESAMHFLILDNVDTYNSCLSSLL